MFTLEMLEGYKPSLQASIPHRASKAQANLGVRLPEARGSHCDRPALATHYIGLLSEGAQQSLATDQPGSMVACIAQLDKLVRLSPQR